ncbi:glycosyl hydrolase [Balneolaceae bacterium YR4-1]|uniref:Glycosyl hydrolase n=1 Tax=Halalkalibaculum roseum TaxID=2709311 RepID=A0A6M1T1P3_9BACT|nr:glycosyl hydrolase [Halalkalibaculum roseum]
MLSIGLLFSAGTSNGLAQNTPSIDQSVLQAFDYRLIGPYRGGRVTTVEGIAEKPSTFYMGTTGGGVWVSHNNGENWKNITDGFLNVGSVGAVSVAPSDPNVIFVGTGSACPRGNVSMGDGIYKSTDAGKTWQHSGLPDAGLIGDVIIDPLDPDRVYVAVLGNIFGPNPERGVYRSIDGGDNWEKILFADEKTGAVDIAINPDNPRILYAAMWRTERKPWTLIDGGDKGGIWKSTDGGDTWHKLGGGLPDGILGRIGVDVSAANPDRVWVLVETDEEKEGGLYRSDNGGETFSRINREHKLRARAWYYNHVHADPNDPETVYVSNAGFYKSTDGGKSFETISTPHGDNHALWINPDNSSIMINGNDGGANVSVDGARSWSTQLNQPTAEFYRVTVDNQFPYRVYGAQQDNTTISVPSLNPGGITPKQHWFEAGGGESGHIAVDPRNPDIIYAGNYIGIITRMDRGKGHTRNVVAYPQLHDGTAPRDIKYRYQWNAPIRISPHDPDVLYHTSQYVHRSSNGGQSWEVISPDLTTNNDAYHDIPGGPVQYDHTGVELYTTIFAFEESPHKAGEFWAGSDDGLVHISRDNGETWTDITPDGMPDEGTVNMIDLSVHQPGRAHIAVYKYRENDFRPYIFRTDNYGKNWELLTDGSNGIPDGHFTRVVREDPQNENILFAGTEKGMYISFDAGSNWMSFQQNLPVTPITDLQIHRNDLVVATQGRSFWIMDDLSVLEQVVAKGNSDAIILFEPPTALRTQLSGFSGDGAPENPPKGARIYYRLPVESDSVAIDILDKQGEKAYSVKKEGKAGIMKVEWDLTYPKPEVVDDAVMSLSYTGGPSAPTGMYTVRLTAGDVVLEENLEITKDPRWTEISDRDLQDQFDLSIAIRDELTNINDAIRTIRSARKQLKDGSKLAVAAGYDSILITRADTLAGKLTALEHQLIQTQNETGQDPINYPPKLDNQIAYLYTVVHGQGARPTEGSYERFEDLKAEAKIYYRQLNSLKKDIEAYNRLADETGVPKVILVPDKNQ